jgi:hypothetical protein
MKQLIYFKSFDEYVILKIIHTVRIIPETCEG